MQSGDSMTLLAPRQIFQAFKRQGLSITADATHFLQKQSLKQKQPQVFLQKLLKQLEKSRCTDLRVHPFLSTDLLIFALHCSEAKSC